MTKNQEIGTISEQGWGSEIATVGRETGDVFLKTRKCIHLKKAMELVENSMEKSILKSAGKYSFRESEKVCRE